MRYLGLGRYGEQLRSLFEHVNREQVYVLRYRELIDAPVGRNVDPRVWRQAQRTLIVALPEDLLSRSFQDWLGDSGRGTFAVRSSLAPSERDASQ